jgi:hypothetical protein
MFGVADEDPWRRSGNSWCCNQPVCWWIHPPWLPVCNGLAAGWVTTGRDVGSSGVQCVSVLVDVVYMLPVWHYVMACSEWLKAG